MLRDNVVLRDRRAPNEVELISRVDLGCSVRDDESRASARDDEFCAEVYGWVLGRPSCAAEDIKAAFAAAPARVERALRHLAALRLVTFDERGRPVGVDPSTAHVELVAPLEREISARHRALTDIQRRLARFGDVFDEVRRANLHTEASFTTADGAHTLRRLADAVAHCTGSASFVQSGDSADGRTLCLIDPFLHGLLRRGVEVRVLVAHTARVHARVRGILGGLAEAGAHIRSSAAPPQDQLVLDGATAFAFASGSARVTVLYDAAAVEILSGLHDHAWESALDFDPGAEGGYGETFGDVQSAILRLLAAGRKDEFIARRLGISERTLRRHVATIMDVLGAESRFQAGVSVGHAGLLSGD